MFGPRRPRKEPIDQGLEFCCESLELRQMLAGDVSAALSDAGVLTIKGNGLSNNVSVYDNGRGVIVVEAHSHDRGGDDEKRVSKNEEDGSDYFSFNAEEVTKVKVRLKGGDDYLNLRIDDTDKPDLLREGQSSGQIDVDAKLGGGDDEANFYGELGDVKTSSEYSHFDANVGHIQIKGNELSMYGANANSLSAKLNGDAYVSIDHSYFDGKVELRTGGGNDSIQVSGSSFNDDVDVNTKGGDDEVSVYAYYNGRYYDYNNFYGDVDVKLGGGGDYLNVNRSSFYGSEITLNGNGGNDGGYFEFEIGLYDGAVFNDPISFEFSDT